MCVFLYKYDPGIALFFVYVGLMQIYDYIFWMNPYKNNVNYYFTKLAMLTNILQPIVLAILLQQFGHGLKKWSKILLLTYVVASVVYIGATWKYVDYTLVQKQSCESLYWQWNYMTGWLLFYTLFVVTMSMLFYENLPRPINLVLTITSLLSLALGTYYFKGNTGGRFWCWLFGFIPLVLVISCIYKQYAQGSYTR